MNIILPDDVERIINRLYDAGYEAFVVGGCVRDYLMDTQPHDWDITTSAKPKDILRVFNDCKVIETGIKHGTVTVVLNDSYEITTYRIDGEYTDNRHPNEVIFTDSLICDLSRRDFTINAMAYNNTTGLIDPFRGYTDLKNGILRCVGNPDTRFNEDALRIMRLIRFSSVLSFNIDKETSDSAMRNKELLKNISVERFSTELNKLIMGNNCFNVLKQYHSILSVIIPEISILFETTQNNPYHVYDVGTHTAVSVSVAEKTLCVRLAMLLHDICKPYCKSTDDNGIDHFYGHADDSAIYAENLLHRLHYSQAITSTVTTLVKYHDADIIAKDKIIKRWLNKLGSEVFEMLMCVKSADIKAQNPEYSDRLNEIVNILTIQRNIEKSNNCFTLKQMNITGKDLLELGFPQSKLIGDTLSKLLQMVIDGNCENDNQILREVALSILQENLNVNNL